MESRLKEIRQHFKLSQGEFGKKIGLSTSAIGEIERGTNRLSNRNVDAICRVFNVNENWLRTGEGEMFNPPKELDFLEKLALERNLTKEDIAIIKSYLDLPPEMRHLVIEFGRNFIKNMSVQLGIEEKIENQLKKIFAFCRPSAVPITILYKYILKQGPLFSVWSEV